MVKITTLAMSVLLLSAASLGGCSVKSEEQSASPDEMEASAENAADNLEEAADNASESWNEAATEAGAALPEFKIPAPKASAQMALPRTMLPAGEPTLEQVGDALRARLGAAGYDELGYYRVTNGFALATRMERIAPDGRPFAGAKRWRLDASGLASFSGGLSLASLRDALVNADPGSYRTMVFVVTNRPVTSTGAAMKSDVAKELAAEGASDLPEGFGQARFTPQYRATALIYEFNRSAVGKPAEFSRPSAVSAGEQLRLAKIVKG